MSAGLVIFLANLAPVLGFVTLMSGLYPLKHGWGPWISLVGLAMIAGGIWINRHAARIKRARRAKLARLGKQARRFYPI